MTPRIGLGCVRLGGGGGRSVADDVRLVRGAIDLGVTVFDTADAYGGGASEHVLGRAVRGRRDDVVLATKAGFVFRPRTPVEQWGRRRAKEVLAALPRRGAHGGGSSRPSSGGAYATQDFSAHHLRAAVRSSLRRLDTDRIDVFQLHGPRTCDTAVIETLADLVIAGDIVRIGVGADTVDDANRWVGVPGVSVVQVPFGVLDPGAATGTMPGAAEAGQQVWVRGLLGGGLLSAADRDPDALADHPKRRQVERLRELAAGAGLDPYELALRFARSHGDGVEAMIVGSSSLDHVRHDLEVLRGHALSDDLVEAVNRIAIDESEEDHS